MAYTFNNAGGNIEVKNGGTVHLVCYAGAGAPPEERDNPADGNNFEYSLELAEWAVQMTRKSLPKGTFNNMIDKGGVLQYLTDLAAPRVLVSRAETMFALLSDGKNFVEQMAARAQAALWTGGGVCSLVSHVCMGFITQQAEDNTLAAIVWDGQWDHSYCVLAHEDSPWVIADPWVARPYAVQWSDNAFPRDHIATTFKFDIKKKVDAPFGVTFDDEALQSAVKSSKVQEPVAERDKLPIPKQALKDKKKYPWFHMEHAYFQDCNLDKSVETQLKLRGYKQICGSADWG